MVKKLLWLIPVFLSASLFAGVLEEKIGTLIDPHLYSSNKRFIQAIFKKQEDFFVEGRLDFAKIAAKLKENGLLQLGFKEPKDLRISFYSSKSPMFFTRAAASSLQGLGYYYFAPKEVEYKNGLYRLDIEMNTESAIDPTLLIREFQKRGYLTVDVVRESETKWRYVFELLSPKLPEAEVLQFNEMIEMTRLSGEYWLDVEGLFGVLHFLPLRSAGGPMYPVVTLFDSSFQIVKVYTWNEDLPAWRVEIFRGVRFVKISDFYSPSNMKNGIKVEVVH